MKITIKALFRYLLVGVFLPLVIQYTVYYRFTPNYLPGIYSEQGFKTMYNNSVFKYRVIGINLQLYVYEKLKNSKLGEFIKEHQIYNKRLLALDANADEYFYTSYFIINTLSCIIASIFFLMIFNYKNMYSMSDAEKNMTTGIFIMLTGLTQYVVTPYDNLSYAMIAISFYLFLIHENKKNLFTLMLLSIAIFITTLVRESSLIILCVMLAIYINRNVDLRLKTLIKKMWAPSLAFFLAYIGIRLYISGTAEIAQSVQFEQNISVFQSSKIIALLFALVLLYFLRQYAKMGNYKLFITYLLVSSPYLIMVILVGILIEFRLWMPFVIGTIFISKLNIQNLLLTKKE